MVEIKKPRSRLTAGGGCSGYASVAFLEEEARLNEMKEDGYATEHMPLPNENSKNKASA